jgi:hypothetical protein
MKLSKDAVPGFAIASYLLHQELLELMMRKGIVTRDEVIEHLDSTVFAAEKLRAALDAAKAVESGELPFRAAIAL